MCFVWIWEQTAIISFYSINWLVFITETECVYCAVRTGSLYIILRSAHTVYLCVLCGSENKQRLFPRTALTDRCLFIYWLLHKDNCHLEQLMSTNHSFTNQAQNITRCIILTLSFVNIDVPPNRCFCLGLFVSCHGICDFLLCFYFPPLYKHVLLPAVDKPDSKCTHAHTHTSAKCHAVSSSWQSPIKRNCEQQQTHKPTTQQTHNPTNPQPNKPTTP